VASNQCLFSHYEDWLDIDSTWTLIHPTSKGCSVVYEVKSCWIDYRPTSPCLRKCRLFHLL